MVVKGDPVCVRGYYPATQCQGSLQLCQLPEGRGEVRRGRPTLQGSGSVCLIYSVNEFTGCYGNDYIHAYTSMCVFLLYCQSAVKVYDGLLPSPRLCPDHASSHNNLGTLLEGEEAEFHLRMAVLHNPRHSRAYYNLGNLLGWVRCL